MRVSFGKIESNVIEKMLPALPLKTIQNFLHNEFLDVEKQIFSTEGEAWGIGGWADYKNKSYKEWKARKYPGKTKLVISGKLAKAAFEGKRAKGSFFVNSGAESWMGVQDEFVPYAKYHQTGTENMEARTFIRVTPELIHRMTMVMSSLIGQFAKKKGKLL
jgi:hypothetical protein